jgi:hypothetical protein
VTLPFDLGDRFVGREIGRPRRPSPDIALVMATNIEPSERTSRLALQPGTIRGVPPFVFSVPEGWVVDELPNALAVVRPPEATDGFWPNVVIRHVRLGASVDLRTAAEATKAKMLKENPEATVTLERLARFGDTVMHMRGVSITSLQTQRPLGQLYGLCIAPKAESAKTVDLIQLIGTALEEADASPAEQFVEILGSFRFL